MITCDCTKRRTNKGKEIDSSRVATQHKARWVHIEGARKLGTGDWGQAGRQSLSLSPVSCLLSFVCAGAAPSSDGSSSWPTALTCFLSPALCIIAAWTLITSVVCAADWPFVRGNSNASAALQDDLSENLDVVWKYSVDDSGFEATAVIAEDKVYLGDVDGTFYSIDMASGDLMWKRTFPESGFLTGAAVFGGRVYVTDFNGVIFCLQASSGEPIWNFQAPSEAFAAPNVQHGLVLVATDAGEVVTLSAQSGELKWRFRIEAPLRCWPTVVDGRVLLAGCDERLHAVDIATAKEVDGVEIDGPTGSTPARLGNDVFFGTEQGTFYSIGSEPLEIRWMYHDSNSNLPIRVSAAVNHHAVVFSNDGKQVYALDPTTGKERWKFTVRSKVESSPVIAGKLVFVATSRGRLHAIDMATGEETWQFEAGGKFLASPALSNGRLVIGNNDGTLYCFGEK